MKSVTNWGNHPVVRVDWLETDRLDAMQRFLVADHTPAIARGLGRCYGDSSLSPRIFSSLAMHRVLAFDKDTGQITCEAGVSFDQLLRIIVPEGWFLPVTPGTKFITVGGAVASDIHGKNHHIEGSFSQHIHALDLMGPDGRIHTCGPEKQTELFRMTCGGMGLTGVIMCVTFQLKKISSAYIAQRNLVARNLEEVMALFETHKEATYSVAWIDGLAKGKALGRSILMLGEHTDAASCPPPPLQLKPSRKLTVPFHFPGFVLNRFSMQAFNAVYYRQPKRRSTFTTGYESFFYPLDGILHWNRIYGKRGFTQYQLVLPMASSEEGITEIFRLLQKEGFGSFLSVLKLFGKGGSGILSFPMEGYTLTLDFPLSDRLYPFLNKLDDLVLRHGGRLYLTKDVRMSAVTFFTSYPGAASFKTFLKQWDPEGRFASLQSNRIGLTTSFSPSSEASAHTSGSSMTNKKSVLILGASEGLGKALALRYARAGWNVRMASRRIEQLENAAKNIETETSVRPSVQVLDVTDIGAHEAFVNTLNPLPDAVICSAGYLGNQDLGMRDEEECDRILQTNFTGPVSLLNKLAAAFAKRGSGAIIGVSSVAGERGRQSNYLYGSAKAGFTAYLSGLRNRLQPDGVHVLTVIPGFMRTPMTEGLPLPGPLTASADRAADDIYRAHQKGRNVLYTLWMWRWIMWIIRTIPENVFKKLKL
ncbi:MAG: SDR family oxidoreductase [Flavobacteriales bacterium]|nr:SDR family oxidoreductase [Flavobacteriales bacterium]MCB9449551.1 SDR family oxidoreductase [Flavobacteriales bacterium]